MNIFKYQQEMRNHARNESQKFFYNMIIQAKESGKTRDINWLHRMVDMNYLKFVCKRKLGAVLKRDYTNEEKAALKNQIGKFLEQLTMLYGDNWDIFPISYYHNWTEGDDDTDYNREKVFSIYPIIHFDQIKITNKYEHDHDIKDLFMAVKFSFDTVEIEEIEEVTAIIEEPSSNIEELLGVIDERSEEEQEAQGPPSIDELLAIANGTDIPVEEINYDPMTGEAVSETAIAAENAEIEEVVEASERVEAFYYRLTPVEVFGTRATLTRAEFCTGYFHSHLSQRDIHRLGHFNFYSFCLGSGEVADLLAEIKENEYDEDNIFLFLNTLKSLADWESIDGNPHIRFDTISEMDKSNTYHGASNANFRDNARHLTNIADNLKIPYDLTYRFVNGKYAIVPDEKLEAFIRLVIESTSSNMRKSEFYEDLFFKRFADGTKTKFPNSSSNVFLESDHITKDSEGQIISFNFRGKRIPLRIGRSTQEKPDITKYTLTDNILKHVKDHTEKRLYKEAIKRSIPV